MVATTYSGAGVAVPTAVPAAAGGKKSKGFWARVFAAIGDSQMRRAERELAMYRHLLPRDFELTQLRREDEPFGGW